MSSLEAGDGGDVWVCKERQKGSYRHRAEEAGWSRRARFHKQERSPVGCWCPLNASACVHQTHTSTHTSTPEYPRGGGRTLQTGHVHTDSQRLGVNSLHAGNKVKLDGTESQAR